jgi:hypothetical protein
MAEFSRFNSTEDGSMSDADHYKSSELAKCLSHEALDAEAALVTACSHSSPRPWCECVVVESKRQYGTPQFFGSGDDAKTRAITEKCVHLRVK